MGRLKGSRLRRVKLSARVRNPHRKRLMDDAMPPGDAHSATERGVASRRRVQLGEVALNT